MNNSLVSAYEIYTTANFLVLIRLALDMSSTSTNLSKVLAGTSFNHSPSTRNTTQKCPPVLELNPTSYTPLRSSTSGIGSTGIPPSTMAPYLLRNISNTTASNLAHSTSIKEFAGSSVSIVPVDSKLPAVILAFWVLILLHSFSVRRTCVAQSTLYLPV